MEQEYKDKASFLFGNGNPGKIHIPRFLLNAKVKPSGGTERNLTMVEAAVIADIRYWTERKTARWDGWLYRTNDEWMEKFGLSESTVTRTLSFLESLGWIEQKRGKLPQPKGEKINHRKWVKFYRSTPKLDRDAVLIAGDGSAPEKRKRSGEGFVYLLRAEGTDRYKIGITKTLKARQSALQKQSPSRLILIATIQSDQAKRTEAFLHARYEQFRVGGEWFDLPSFAVDEFLALKAELEATDETGEEW